MRNSCCFLAATLMIVCVNGAFQTKSIVLPGIARDIWPCTNVQYKCGKEYNWSNKSSPLPNPCDKITCHPNFESVNSGLQYGIVRTTLNNNVDRKPVYDNSTTHSSFVDNGVTFDAWYNKNEKYNLEYPVNLVLTNNEASPGIYTYYSSAFFPLDDMGFGNYYMLNGIQHNYGFTFEIKSRFTYTGKETFDFAGDDDVWVFINNILAIDIGGVHGQATASIQLNKSETKLGISKGNTYNFDFFFAERHTSGSNLKISTSIELFCKMDRCGICDGDGQSCCNCTDNNLCTKDTCDENNNYNCVFTPLPCPTINLCYTSACNATSGCVQSPVVCNDNNKCTTDACDINTGKCVFTPIALTCNATDQCHTAGTCDPATGACTNPLKPNGTACSDPDFCITGEYCNAKGVCEGKLSSPCFPYLLITNQTTKIGVTQSTWIPIYFMGLTNITKFQITVLNYPALYNLIDDGNYLETMIKYPGTNNYTAPYKFNGLATNDIDYVAIKFLPSQTAFLRDATLSFQVSWNTSYGRSGVNNHTVTIPVEKNLLSFSIPAVDLNLGSMGQADDKWFSVNVVGLQRLVNFTVTCSSATNLITFTYPRDRSYTSLNLYNYVNVNVTDFFAFRVVTDSKILPGTYPIVATVAWSNGTIPLSFPIVLGIKIELGLKRQASSSVSGIKIYPDTLSVSAGSNLWSVASIKSEKAVSQVNVKVTPKVSGAIVISYPNDTASSNIGDLGTDSSSFAAFNAKAPEGQYPADVTVSYMQGGISNSFVQTINIKSSAPSITIKSATLAVDAGQSSLQSFGYSSVSNISGFTVNLDSLPGWKVNVQTTTASSDDWFATFEIIAAANASGYYVLPVVPIYTDPRRQAESSESVLGVYVRASSVSSPTPGSNNEDSNGSNSAKTGFSSGATAGVVVGGVVIVAAGVVVVVVVRRRRNRKVDPGFRFKEEGRRSAVELPVVMLPPQTKS